MVSSLGSGAFGAHQDRERAAHICRDGGSVVRSEMSISGPVTRGQSVGANVSRIDFNRDPLSDQIN